MGVCQRPCRGYCLEKQCPLFIEDLKWLSNNSVSSPIVLEKIDAKIASTSRPLKGGISRLPRAGKIYRASLRRRQEILEESGRQLSLNIFAGSGRALAPMPGLVALTSCHYCGGPIDPGQPFRVTRRVKRHRNIYHAWCLEYMLKRGHETP